MIPDVEEERAGCFTLIFSRLASFLGGLFCLVFSLFVLVLVVFRVSVTKPPSLPRVANCPNRQDECSNSLKKRSVFYKLL